MRPEDRLRARCRMLCQTHVLPPTYWTAIEHGRQHHGTKEQRAREWERLKAQGVKTGVADFLLQRRGLSLWQELKVDTEQSGPQEAFEAEQLAIGNGYEIARTVTQFGENCEKHGIALKPGWRVKAGLHDLELAAAQPPPKVRKVGTTTGKVARRPTLKQVARGNRLALVGIK